MGKETLLKGKKILVVDDEPEVLDTLAELLDMCQLVRATSFEAARDLLRTQYFDIAVLDIMGVDGFRLLEIATDKKMLAVMLTAYALRPENIRLSLEKGAAYFVPKDRIADIAIFLGDVLAADQKGTSHWNTWADRLDGILPT